MRFSGRSGRGRAKRTPYRVGLAYQGTMRAAVAFALCVLMVDQPLMAANVAKRGPSAGVQPMKGEDRVLHALNRLTFGPRPGDVAAVQQMGLSTWFETQLNPAQIDDSALQAKLAQFPAMQMPQGELIARYPTQQVIRQMDQRGQFLPSDPVERAIYGDQLAFYRAQKAKQAQEKNATAATAGEPNGNAGESMAANAAPAPVVRRSRQATPSDAAGASMGMDAAAGEPGTMAANGEEGTNQQAPAVLNKDFADAGQAPAQHVEQLYRDLDAVKIINLPPDDRMRRVLAMAPKDFVAFRQSLSAGELVQFAQGLSPQQREIFAALQNSTRMVGAEEMQVRLLRDIYSDRQLEAVMTDFWLNHFNVYVRKNQNEPYLIPSYERDVIRPHALGKFEDLLVATAESPAMLMYLDNWESIGPDSPAAKQGPQFARFGRTPQAKAAAKDRGLNENYGRELMELHTVGVNGGYTQADVTQVAKVFTGWTLLPLQQGGGFQFVFEDRRHEPGSKTVMGRTIREAGMKEGLEVLHMLATSPATARFISTKLAVRFVSDDPPPALVDRMAQTFLQSNGDIKSVLRTMFESPEFWAPAAQRSKVKTPLEFVVSAVRASNATVNNALPLVQALDKLGMPLYGMQTPNGYSWMSEPWVSTGALVSRMNFALVLAGDKLPGVRTDWTKLLGGFGGAGRQVAMESGDGAVDPEVAAKEKRLEQVLLGQPLSEKTRAAVLSQSNDQTAAIQAAKEFQVGGGGGAAANYGLGPLLGPAGMRGGAQDDRQAAIMAGLMLGSPEFQRR